MSAADRVIRASTTIAVLGVAGVAAYVSYWHAYEVVRAHGETGITARLEPATIDGLVYCSSMVVLYAARHQLRAPGLARWLLALGIVATLAANVAHGWSHGPIGAAVAAWPAASLVGSYELLLWLIRTAATRAPDHVPASDDQPVTANHQAADMGLVTNPGTDPAVTMAAPGDPLVTNGLACNGTDHTSGPGWPTANRPYQGADHRAADLGLLIGHPDDPGALEEELAAAAVTAYRASIANGQALSERQLAAMFGKTSRRWARNRMTEASRDSGMLTTDKANASESTSLP